MYHTDCFSHDTNRRVVFTCYSNDFYTFKTDYVAVSHLQYITVSHIFSKGNSGGKARESRTRLTSSWTLASNVQLGGFLLATLYFIWLGMLIYRSFRHISAMNPEYIFIMVITLVTIIGAMSAVYTGALAPDQVCWREKFIAFWRKTSGRA